jgi:hypothetical protein
LYRAARGGVLERFYVKPTTLKAICQANILTVRRLVQTPDVCLPGFFKIRKSRVRQNSRTRQERGAPFFSKSGNFFRKTP